MAAESQPALEARELGWEPTAVLPAVDDAHVREWLAPWPELRDRPWQRLGGGLRSLNLRIGDVVARIGVGAHALGKEETLLRSLEEVRVPRVVDARGQVLLLEYVDHEPLPATATAGERTGRAAAAIHRRAFSRAGLLDDALAVTEPWPSALGGLLDWIHPVLAGTAGERLGPLADDVRRLWAAEHEAMAADHRAVLLHADFKPMNLGWLPAAGDVVVFDWEFAWAGPPLFDLGQLLRWNPPASFVEGLERGYLAAGGQLPPRWQRLAELFDLFNLVAFLDHPRACERRVADVTERIRATLAA